VHCIRNVDRVFSAWISVPAMPARIDLGGLDYETSENASAGVHARATA
jgi:hypothetical protein